MNRKTFFKNILLALGSLVVPNAILRTEKIKNATSKCDFEKTEIGGPIVMPYETDGEEPLFRQMQSYSKMHLPVKASKYYWTEYESKGGFKVISV